MEAANKQKKSKFNLGRLGNKISTIDKIFFMQNLEVMVRAGFSLSSALTTVAEQTKKKQLKKIMTTIAADVEGGQTFADALRQYERIFGALFINMIESGEVSGKLELTLKELTVQLKRSHFLFLKVRNALAYPIVLLIALLIVGVAMMIFVMPKIVQLYSDASYELPIITRIVMAVSNFILKHGILSGVIVIVVVILFILVYRQEKAKRVIHRIILHLPIAGKIVQEYNLARFHRIFHSLLTTDIPIVQTLTIITKTIGNRAYRQYLYRTIPQLEKGVAIGEVMAQDELLFPPTVVAMMKVAETSGSLESTSQEIAEHYEQEVASTLDALSVLIEPVLMLVLGLVVAVIALAVLWPMYSLVNVL